MIGEFSFIQGRNTAFVSIHNFLCFVPVCVVLRHLPNNLFIALDDDILKQDNQGEQCDYNFALHFDFTSMSAGMLYTRSSEETRAINTD